MGVYVLFYLIEQHLKFMLNNSQLLCMCTLCDSTYIKTIIEFVPYISLWWFQWQFPFLTSFPGYTRTLSLEIVHNTFEWNCQMVVVSRIWCGIAAGQLYPTIIFNNPVLYRLWLEYSQIKTVGCFRWPALVSWVPLIADCYLLWGVNLYQAQNSRLPRVAVLHVINVAAVIEF